VREFLFSTRTFITCPKRPVTLVLDGGLIEVDFTIAVDGNAISWTPSAYGISNLRVTDSAHATKWELATDPGKVMRGPIVYGVPPFGATQVFPARGAPPALAAGDVITIDAIGASSGGFPYFGSGIAFR